MKQSLCDSARLAALLEGRLDEQAERELNSHLDVCQSCANQLEAMAAGPERWQQAKSLLSATSKQTPLTKDPAGHELPFTVRQVVEMLDPTDDPKFLGRLGSYEIVGVVGSGAMGVVMKASDRTLDRVVAVKVMNPTLAACGTARQRFAREAKAAAGVLHPNVIAIHGVSTDQALPYLVMPFISGASLQQRLDQQGPLALPEILRIGCQVAAGLAAAHQHGLIHRDIKPSNIMLDQGVETAVITDFGLARTIDDATMTRSGAITGTPEFMSPEQARGDAVDCSSDVFSLASVLYAMATGRSPFRAKTPFGVLRKISDDSPAPIRELNSEVPRWFCDLVAKMQAKSPAERPTSAEVRDWMKACLAHVYQPDQLPLPEQLSTKEETRFSLNLVPFTKNPLTTGVISIMTLLIIATLSIFASTFVQSNAPATKDVEVFQTITKKFPNLDQRGKLIVDINRGFVEVTGHDRSDVIIEVLYPPGSNPSKKKEGELKSIFAPKFDLDVEADSNSIDLDTYNQDYVLNLRIKVPYQTDLSLDNYIDGYLKVENVSGAIKAESQHDDIRLLGVSGTATASNYNGNITVRFKRVDKDAKLDFESYNGNIDVSLPTSIAATTAVSTGTGNYQTSFELERVGKQGLDIAEVPKVKRNLDEYQFGKINGGGIPLRIESEKGLIRIRKSDRPMPLK